MQKTNSISELWIVPAPMTLSTMSAAVGMPLEQAGNVTLLTDESSIKLDAIRQLKKDLSTHASREGRVVVIYPAEKLLLPAQQALLKLFEEPPENTRILLFASSPQSVLPTIVSRCAVRHAAQTSTNVHTEENQTLWQQLARCRTDRERVALAQGLPAKKAEFLELLHHELASTASSDQLADGRYSEFRLRVLEVIEALQSNTTPALCAVRLIFGAETTAAP